MFQIQLLWTWRVWRIDFIVPILKSTDLSMVGHLTKGGFLLIIEMPIRRLQRQRRTDTLDHFTYSDMADVLVTRGIVTYQNIGESMTYDYLILLPGCLPALV